jgi:A/G-specific adenine glycosylase
VDDTAARLLDWYGQHARTLPWRAPPGAAVPKDPDWPYRAWLSEIMLQQTTVAAVKDYFAKFTARWPNVAALAAADDAEVMAAWAGLGYYARARNLLAAARAVVADHNGRFPDTEERLRTLPGVGPYTAAAIAAFAFGRHAIVIDGNVERVITRRFAITTPLPVARAEIRTQLETLTPPRAGDFAQALMDLATRICTPKSPRCDACPITPGCAARALGTPESFPVKAAKRPRPTRRGTAWWLEADGQVLTIIRPPRGLLGGMRALPSCDWRSAAPAPPFPGDWQHIGSVRHGFTHFELELDVLALRLPSRPPLTGDWLPAHTLANGLPTLFQKAALLALAQFPLPEAA